MEAHLLLNHKLRGVSAGYITGALLSLLVVAQERVSSEIVRWIGSRHSATASQDRTIEETGPGTAAADFVATGP
jgi:hypothetical protein